MTLAKKRQGPGDTEREQTLLKYFSIAVAIVVGIFAIIARWLPSVDLPLRVFLLTSVSFGTTIIIRRKDLRQQATWTILVVGALIHFVVIWAIHNYLSIANMWIVGVFAIVEAILLLVSIEMCKPPGERWNS